MSNWLEDGDPAGTMARDERINANTRLIPTEQGAMEGFAKGVGMHAMRAAANVARTVSMAGAALPVLNDAIHGGTEQQDEYFSAHDDMFQSSVDYWTPKAGEVGKAGQIVGGLVEGLAPLMLGPAGVPAMLGNATVGTAIDLQREGVPVDKALVVGGIAGVSNALGFKIPFLGNTLASRITSGAAGNLAVNTPATALQQQALKGTKQAEQFDPANVEARAMDILLGAAFGGYAHAVTPKRAMTQGEVDAALALRNASQFQERSAPGIPVDQASSQAHQAAMEQAMGQLLRGEKVEVDGQIVDAAFLPRPGTAATPIDIPKPPIVADNRPGLVDVVLAMESGGKRFGKDGKLLTSPKGAQGEMQVMPGTATDPGFGVKPAKDNSPEELARVGRDYLAAMEARYPGDPGKAMAAYNAGPGAVDKAVTKGGADWLKSMPAETQAYVGKGLGMLGDRPAAVASSAPAKPEVVTQPKPFDINALATEAAGLLSGGRKAADVVAALTEQGLPVSPELHNTLIAAEHFGERMPELTQHYTDLAAEQPGAKPFDLIADAFDRMRQGQPTKAAAAKPKDPMQARLDDMVAQTPAMLDMPVHVAFDAAGQPARTVTAREFLDQAKAEHQAEMQEASLVEVAANCFLNLGAGAV